MLLKVLQLGLLLSLMTVVVQCTPPNLHTRSAHDHHNNKERIDDAFDAHLQHVSEHQGDDDHELDHEAILGSRQKAAEFDGLSAEESKRRLKALVEKGGMDANGDGFVDKEELSNWVLKSFKNLAMEEGEDRLEEDDEDDNGLVSWEEYLKGSFDIDELSKDKGNRNELLEEDKVLWKAADINGDGFLDAQEFAAFHSPEEFEHMHDILVKQLLERRDHNKDGFIDFAEYISDERGEVPDARSEQYISEKDKFESNYDRNGDKKLDWSECLDWIVPNNTEIAENEAQHLITSADDDNDGRLSVQEIIDSHEVFVGSEATHFGEQLRDEL